MQTENVINDTKKDMTKLTSLKELKRLFEMVFGDNTETVLKILLAVRNHPGYGLRLREQNTLVEAIGITRQRYFRIRKKMEDWHLLERVSLPIEYPAKTTKGKHIVTKTVLRKTAHIVLARNTIFSNMLSNANEQWIRLKRSPETTDVEEIIGKDEELVTKLFNSTKEQQKT